MERLQIRKRDILADIRAGLDDADIMAKYGLTAKGLAGVFSKLVKADLITQAELDRRMPGFRGIARIAQDLDEPTQKGLLGVNRATPAGKPEPVVSARQVLKDIRQGLLDVELMVKYQLSARGLQHLFDQLVAANLVTYADLDARMPAFESTVDLRETIQHLQFEIEEPVSQVGSEDVAPRREDRGSARGQQAPRAATGVADRGKASGAKVEAPTTDHAVKAPPLPRKTDVRSAPPQEEKKTRRRPITLQEISKDIRSGMSDQELMDKYGLTGEKLQRAFRQLLAANAVTLGELYGRPASLPGTTALPMADLDIGADRALAFPIPIFEQKNPAVVGRVREISEFGLGLIGIQSQVNENKTLVIVPEKFVDMKPITLRAKCLWARTDPKGQHVAGFRIFHISETDLQRLRDMIGMLTIGL